jgi:sterol desaturase/sphingolipid hydroxylase (fatty acid hydroxylase superfamily)
MDLLIFLAVAVGSYYLMSFLQTVLHRDFGHRKVILPVFKAHAIGHHGQYNPNNLQTEKFIDLESHALNYYGIPIVIVAAVVWMLAGPLVMTAHLLGVFVTFRLNIYLHRHYHLVETPLERFAWFRKKRALHYIHHRDARYNFAVIEFWMDHLLGTRKDPEAAETRR